MKEGLTEIVCVVDRSGSMHEVRSDAIGGFNAFLAEQKRLPGEARLTLVLFNHEYTPVHQGVPIASVPPLDESTYVPQGTTALLDAVGRTIEDVGKRLAATPEGERPSKVIVGILTDGLENSSTDYTRSRVLDLINRQRSVYKWEFVFLAANQNAIQEGAAIGIAAHDAMTFAATGLGTQKACLHLSAAVASYRMTGRKGDWKQESS